MLNAKSLQYEINHKTEKINQELFLYRLQYLFPKNQGEQNLNNVSQYTKYNNNLNHNFLRESVGPKQTMQTSCSNFPP